MEKVISQQISSIANSWFNGSCSGVLPHERVHTPVKCSSNDSYRSLPDLEKKILSAKINDLLMKDVIFHKVVESFLQANQFNNLFKF
jgi:hypothetical protein